MGMAYPVLQGHLGVTCHLVRSGEAMAQGGQAESPAQICTGDDSPPPKPTPPSALIPGEVRVVKGPVLPPSLLGQAALRSQ